MSKPMSTVQLPAHPFLSKKHKTTEIKISCLRKNGHRVEPLTIKIKKPPPRTSIAASKQTKYSLDLMLTLPFFS